MASKNKSKDISGFQKIYRCDIFELSEFEITQIRGLLLQRIRALKMLIENKGLQTCEEARGLAIRNKLRLEKIKDKVTLLLQMKTKGKNRYIKVLE